MKKALLAGGVVVIFLFYTTLTQAFESSPIGWASLTDGNAPYTITGGSAGATVIATDETTFKAYATSTTPYVILVPTTITMTRGTSINDTPQTILLESNKTIIGIGYNSGIIGGFDIDGKNNIIIRNLNISYVDNTQGSTDPWTDGITMQNGTHHVWVDHCNFFDSPDGLCDPTKQSNYITISWNKFYYTAAKTQPHNFTNLVGSSDTAYADRGKLKETFHHNWWTNGCKERMPRVRFGQVHVFNNYYSNLASSAYCQGVGNECQIRVENNYYNGSTITNPWKDYYKSPGVVGKIGWNTGNVFVGCTQPTWATNSYSTIFVPPYSYTLDAGSSINTIVPNGAGVNKLTPSPNPMTFSVAPYAVSSSSISMTASTATCQDGVEYYFTCTAGGGHDSGWQTSTSYTDTGLSPSTTYTYTVLTRNLAQTIFTGAASSPASATTNTDTTPPAKPTGLTATAGYAIVGLVWNNNSESDLAGYNVYRSTTSGSGYGKLNGALLTDLNYIDDINTTDITYYYVVTAVDTASNESNDSNEVYSGLYGDFTGNDIVSLNDLAEFVIYWLSYDCNETAGVDLNDDCMVNFDEFTVFADNWMKE
jgi:pectate lyase